MKQKINNLKCSMTTPSTYKYTEVLSDAFGSN